MNKPIELKTEIILLDNKKWQVFFNFNGIAFVNAYVLAGFDTKENAENFERQIISEYFTP